MTARSLTHTIWKNNRKANATRWIFFFFIVIIRLYACAKHMKFDFIFCVVYLHMTCGKTDFFRVFRVLTKMGRSLLSALLLIFLPLALLTGECDIFFSQIPIHSIT